MVGERRENIDLVEVAIQRVLAYRRRLAMLQFTLNEDLKDLMHLQRMHENSKEENIDPVEVAIQRVLAYRRRLAMLQFTLNEDLKDLMHLQVLSPHSSPSHSPRPLERPSASASLVPSTTHSVLSSLSSPSHIPRPLEGPSSSPSPSPSPVPSTNLSGIKQKELTNCLQYLQPEQPGLSHGSVMLKDQIDNLSCKICQVQCSGAFNLEQHFKGRKHKAKLEQLELNRKYGGEKTNQLQYCELCKVPCMNETLLKQHCQGKKHKRKLQEGESLKHGEEREREVPKRVRIQNESDMIFCSKIDKSTIH